MGTVLAIPIVKGKAPIEFDTDLLEQFDAEVYREIITQGLKTLLNRGMSKIETKDLTGEKLEEAKAAAMTKASENLESLKAGKVRKTKAASASKVAGAVMTEAKRLARIAVKDLLKAAGKKVSHYSSAEITKAAVQLIESDPKFLEEAQFNLDVRVKANVSTVLNLDSIPVDTKKIAKAERDKEEKAAQLSAKQAGQVKKATKKDQHAH